MTESQVTRSRVESLANAINQGPDTAHPKTHPGWAVLKTSNPFADPKDGASEGLFLVGEQARLYQEALKALEEEEAVEHLTRADLDEALFALVRDLEFTRSGKLSRSAIRRRIGDFFSNLVVPPTHYEVAFSVENINLNDASLAIGDVVFREFTQELAQEWEFDKARGLVREVLCRTVGLPVGIVTVQGRSARKAAERAQDSLERALNTLRVSLGSITRTKTWDRELLQRRGQARVMRETSPEPKLISTGGGPKTDPIDLVLTSHRVDSANEFIGKLTPLYDGTIQGRFRDALLRSIEWIGVSITRQYRDHQPAPIYTLSPSATPYPTYTPRPTHTPYPTATPVPSPTPTPMPSPTPTATPLPPQPTPTATPSLPELHDTEHTRWWKRTNPSLYRQIQRFLWVQDGLSEVEIDTIDDLLYMAAGDIANVRAVLGMPWLQDAVSETEYNIIYWLKRVGHEFPQATAAMIPMPFLESPDTDDAFAIRGVNALVYEGLIEPLMDHPTFQDGVTDAETILFAAAGTLRDAGEIGRFLTPGYAAIETVSIEPGRSPDLKVSIVRTETQSRPGTISAVMDAVELVERVMQSPLPTGHVIVILNTKSVPAGYGAFNFSFAMSFLPEYEQPRDTYEWRRLQAVLVHEMSHYYWLGNNTWIDEGVANTVGYIHGLEMGLSRGQLRTWVDTCEAHDIEMLVEANPTKDSEQFLCHYYLGERLFKELLESLSVEAFGAKLKELYQLTRKGQKAGQTPGIAAVRQVFKRQAALVDKHWSGALNAPENRAFDEGVYRESHHLIQWDQHPTYDGRSVTFEGTLMGDAVLVNADPRSGGLQNFILALTDKPEFAGHIFPDVSGWDWTLNNDGDAVASEYLFHPATRKFTVTFPFPTALDNPEDYAVEVRGFQDASRTPRIGDGDDLLGYARIRVP